MLKFQWRWNWKDQLTIVALFIIANLAAYVAAPILLPHVAWQWAGIGLFILLLVVRAAVLRACGRPLFGH